MSQLYGVLPEVILAAAGALVLMLSPWFAGRGRGRDVCWLASLALAAACGATLMLWEQHGPYFAGMVHVDAFVQASRLLLYSVILAVALASFDYLESGKIVRGEFYALLLFIACGSSIMVLSVDLILMFLGLEILSIGAYILAGYQREHPRTTEASLKYFLLGAFSSAVLLYGVALIYGRSGSTAYSDLEWRMRAAANIPLAAGLGLVLTGFGFKAALAPFHLWTPDVYEGAPTPVTAFMSVAVKAAAFLALLRVLFLAFPGLAPQWTAFLWMSAAATMLLGNITALAQSNIKRLLAYSSIAHAGTMLLGVIAANQAGVSAILFYLVAYALMNLGAFTVIQLVGGTDDSSTRVQDFAGLGRTNRWLAACLALSLFSLAGIPGTAGFMGKFFLFSAGAERGLYGLVILAILSSVIALYYYVRVVVLMLMQDPESTRGTVSVPVHSRGVIAAAAAGTVWLGLYPQPVIRAAQQAALALFR